jgi:hypothetical protein
MAPHPHPVARTALLAVVACLVAQETTSFLPTPLRSGLSLARPSTRRTVAMEAAKASGGGSSAAGGVGGGGGGLKLRLADGTEYMVAKKRKRRKSDSSSESQATATAEAEAVDSAEEEQQQDAELAKQLTKRPEGVSTEVRAPAPASSANVDKLVDYAGKGALGMVVAGVFVYQKLKTGSWFDWTMQKFDDASNRRTAVQDESQLGDLNMLSCSNCGYTIFPALGRTFRFDQYTQKCANCGAKGTFYDKNDPDDPRNQKEDGSNAALEQREYMKSWIKADHTESQKLREKMEVGVQALERKGKAVPKALKVDIADKKIQDAEDAAEAAEAAEAAAAEAEKMNKQETRGATTVISLNDDDGELQSGAAAGGMLVDVEEAVVEEEQQQQQEEEKTNPFGGSRSSSSSSGGKDYGIGGGGGGDKKKGGSGSGDNKSDNKKKDGDEDFGALDDLFA